MRGIDISPRSNFTACREVVTYDRVQQTLFPRGRRAHRSRVNEARRIQKKHSTHSAGHTKALKGPGGEGVYAKFCGSRRGNLRGDAKSNMYQYNT